MRFLKRLFDFYINSSIHVALAVFSLAYITLLNFDMSYNRHVLYFIFFATISGYNFVKYFGVAKFHHRSLTRSLKSIQIFSFFIFIVMCYYAFQLRLKTAYAIIILGIITFLYAIPFLPKKIRFDEAMNLRAIGGFKIYVIAFVWSSVTVILPLIDSGFEIGWDVIITAIQRFIYVLVAMLPFEIRDMQFDSVRLSTIPQQIGIRNTKIIGVLTLIPFFFLEFFKDEISPVSVTSLLIVTTLVSIGVVISKTKQSEYFASFWVESIPIIWLLVTLVGTTYL